MAENEKTTPEQGDQQAAQQQVNPEFAIQRVYLKDASLEMPNAPEILLVQEAPSVDIQLEVSETPLSQADIYEVCVRATVTAKTNFNNEQRTVFLVECKQAGIFLIRGVPEEQKKLVIGITCPTILYPYLRSNVCDLLTRAGMPPVYLSEVNFEAYYHQRLQQQQAQEASKATKQ